MKVTTFGIFCVVMGQELPEPENQNNLHKLNMLYIECK